MSRAWVSLASAALSGAVLAGLLAVEARLTESGERKLAAGTNGLAAVAAIAVLVCLTMLAGHLARTLRDAAHRPGGRVPAGAPEASLDAERAERPR